MPKTSFPRQPDRLNDQENKTRTENVGYDYYKWQKQHNTGTSFILSDGPPFANGNLHIGHALNKILKDIVLRSKVIQGHNVIMRPGWDCHGLPIEVKAVTEMSKDSDPLQVRQRCRAFAMDAVQNQKQMMRSWGLMADYDHPYLTMDKEYEAEQLKCFAKMVDLGLVYRALRPVYWSPSSRTALAEAELEYQDLECIAAFVAMPLLDGDENLLIWTTTPWTLPANQAVAVNATLQYCRVVDNSGNQFIVAKDCLNNVTRLGLEYQCDVDTGYLLSRKYKSPLTGNVCSILDAPFVKPETGTGLVHLAPSYGHDDFEACRKHSIVPVSIVNDAGEFTCDGIINGLSIFDEAATYMIFKQLGSNCVLTHKIAHRYPVDWRTKKPVIIRATNQWFIDITKISTELHDAIDQLVSFHPQSGKDKLHRMIDSRTSWCISRQRNWGVPIPAFHHITNNDDIILDSKVINSVSDIVRKQGTDCWWQLDVDQLLQLPGVDNSKYRKGLDTMDVWFDSGTAWTQSPQGQANLAIEGSDQFRGWFQSSLITSLACQSKPAYSTILTHGFVLDEAMRKMSKSLGNVVNPSEVIAQYGVDTMRLWVASSQFTEDLSYSETVMKTCKESYLKVRNTFKFMLGNLHDHSVNAVVEPLELDRLAIGYSKWKLQAVIEDYNKYEFAKGYQSIMSFVNSDLSGFYLDSIKDRLYLSTIGAHELQSAQLALQSILTDFAITLAPLCPLLIAEVSAYAKMDFSRMQFEATNDAKEPALFEQLRALRKQVHSLATIPMNQCNATLPEYFSDAFTEDTLRDSLGCVSIEYKSDISEPFLTASKMHKCPRCWYFQSDNSHMTCEKCREQLKFIENVAR